MKLPGTAAMVVLATTVSAQGPTLTVEAVVERVAGYLLAYEPELSALVADESYDQRATRSSTAAKPGRAAGRRKIESAVSFMRLPGGAAWIGVREVRRVDGRTVAHGEIVQALLAAPGDDTRRRAAEVAMASAAHNLGGARTINMPTLPLEFLHPKNMDRLTFRLGPRDTLRGVRTIRLEFDERGTPTIIRGAADGRWVIARGIAWVDVETGAIVRAQVFYRDYYSDALRAWVPLRTAPAPANAPRASSPAPRPRVPPGRPQADEASVDVEFARDGALGLLVPKQMREVFAVPLGKGEGVATYSNYRRFTTSARLVPQQP